MGSAAQMMRGTFEVQVDDKTFMAQQSEAPFVQLHAMQAGGT